MRQAQISTNSVILWIVFLFSITIVLISLIPVVFPAFFSSLVQSSILLELSLSEKIDPFEIGVMAVPLFVSSIITLGLTFLYFKNKIPSVISKLFENLFKFEISKRITIISIIAILGIYVTFTVGELTTEETWLDYENTKKHLENWSLEKATSLVEPHVRFFLLSTSMTLFGNYAILAFVGSVALLLTVYLITKEITKKRFAGIVAMLIVMQSNTFLTYDTSVTYDNFWILFYLLSLYTIIRAWPLSPVLYLISIPSKALTAVFLPMSLFFVYRANIPKKEKIILLGTYAVIGIIGVIAFTSFNLALPVLEATQSNVGFWQGFTAMALMLRFDWLVILFLIPLIVGLFIASRYDYKYADAILVLIGIFLFIAPILSGFTYTTNQPYRFLPLIVFFAIGVGVLLSRTTKDE